MKLIAITLAGALALATAAAAQNMSNMPDMSNMSGMKGAMHGHGTGVIKAIDAKAGTMTIQHGPIPGLGWPAMTMTFKASPPALLEGLKAGQKIDSTAPCAARPPR